MLETPVWPEEGEDFEEIDHPTLHEFDEGDQIFIEWPRGVMVFILGANHIMGSRKAREVFPGEPQRDVWLRSDQRFELERMAVGGSYEYIHDGHGGSSTGCIRILAIRVVRAEPAPTAEPTTCPGGT